MTYLWPVLFAMFLWWFATGAIIYLDGLPRRTFRWSMLGASVLLVAGLYGVHTSASDSSVAGAYLAFASALAVWAWHEVSFYMGYVTGPRKHACEEGCSGIAHFGHALKVSLWHELAILVSAGLILAISWDADNKVGLWTFFILWTMHESARLNVVLGVRNVNAHFLPPHLDYLKSFLNVKPMNLLFPFSITIATGVFAALVFEAVLTSDPAGRVGLSLLATMLALAILEHWFLVLPVPAEAMWNWSLGSREDRKPREARAAGQEHRPAHPRHLVATVGHTHCNPRAKTQYPAVPAEYQG